MIAAIPPISELVTNDILATITCGKAPQQGGIRPRYILTHGNMEALAAHAIAAMLTKLGNSISLPSTCMRRKRVTTVPLQRSTGSPVHPILQILYVIGYNTRSVET